MNNRKNVIVAVMAALGLAAPAGGAAQPALAPRTHQERSVQDDLVLGRRLRKLGSNSLALYPATRSGWAPKDWGTSPMCRQMVRKNRLRAAGIRGSRI